MKLKQTLATALLLLSLATPLAAQTNDCDITAPTSFSVNAGIVAVTTCWNKLDTSTPPQPVSAQSWGLIVDGTRSTIAMAELAMLPSPSGLYKYQGSFTLAKGTHTVDLEVVIDDGAGGTLSARLVTPLSVKSKGAGPKNPVNGRISKITQLLLGTANASLRGLFQE